MFTQTQRTTRTRQAHSAKGTRSCGESRTEEAVVTERSRHLANQRIQLMNCAAELERITVDSINRGAAQKQRNRMDQTNCNPVIQMQESSSLPRYNAQRPLKIEKAHQNRAKHSTLTNSAQTKSVAQDFLWCPCAFVHTCCIRTIVEAGIDVAGRLRKRLPSPCLRLIDCDNWRTWFDCASRLRVGIRKGLQCERQSRQSRSRH